MTFVVPANFFCLFKTGDNVIYNLSSLNSLYEVYRVADQQGKDKLIKSMVLLEMAIKNGDRDNKITIVVM